MTAIGAERRIYDNQNDHHDESSHRNENAHCAPIIAHAPAGECDVARAALALRRAPHSGSVDGDGSRRKVYGHVRLARPAKIYGGASDNSGSDRGRVPQAPLRHPM